MGDLRIGVALGIGLVAAGVGTRSGLPGAPIVFPILAVAAWKFYFLEQTASMPALLQFIAFGLLGTSIGLSIDRASLQTIRSDWPILLLIVVSVYLAASIVMVVIARVFHFDLTTAMLAGSPGGLVGVSAVSLSAGANVAQVVAAQTLRLLIIFASLPFLLAALKRFR